MSVQLNSFLIAKITLFAQIIALLPKEIIKKIIRNAGTDKYCKGYNTWSQLISIVFCQFSHCDSVRDVSNGLKSATGNLNHLGISRAPSKSTVAYQNAHRDSTVFRDIFYAVFIFDNFAFAFGLYKFSSGVTLNLSVAKLDTPQGTSRASVRSAFPGFSLPCKDRNHPALHLVEHHFLQRKGRAPYRINSVITF